ncbi:MAG TPA: ROK family protein [Armatimonadota bacterium]|jgi:glucokinase
MNKELLALGVDLGGTTFTAGLLTRAGHLLGTASSPTPTESATAVYAALEQTGRRLLEAHGNPPLAGVGIGVPGLVVPATGQIIDCPNLAVMDGTNAAEQLRSSFVVDTALVGNDAFCATLAELRYGAGQGAGNLLLLTLGTGVGGGVVLNDQAVRGPRQLMGEIGHMIVAPRGRKCGCGNFGCLEAMVAKQAMIDLALQRLQRGRASLLEELSGGDDEAITPELISQAARQGDAVAAEVIGQVAEYLGIAICNAILMLDPDRVLIGGGIAAAGELLLEPIRRTVRHRGRYARFDTTQILPAQLGNLAGTYGAGALVWEGLRVN